MIDVPTPGEHTGQAHRIAARIALAQAYAPPTDAQGRRIPGQPSTVYHYGPDGTLARVEIVDENGASA